MADVLTGTDETSAVLESRPAAHDMPELDPRIEAFAFRKLLEHLRLRQDVTNVEMMGVTGFCRNCLAEWLEDGAAAVGVPMTENEARKHVYAEPYADWKSRQAEATPEQLARMAESKAENDRVHGRTNVEKQLDHELDVTFPASDPLQISRPESGGAAA